MDIWNHLGGGAVCFDLQLEKSIINDINESLINAYLQIKISPEEFADAISEYDKRIADGGKVGYYKSPGETIMINDAGGIRYGISCFIRVLNKHCFNGLYRVNGRGLFNVPYNNSVRESCSKESIMAVSTKPSEGEDYERRFSECL